MRTLRQFTNGLKRASERFTTAATPATLVLGITLTAGCESGTAIQTYDVEVYGEEDADTDTHEDADTVDTDTHEDTDVDEDTGDDFNPIPVEDDDDDESSDDEGHTSIYCLDADGDGYGDPTEAINSETVANGYVDDCTDCNDDSSAVHPGADDSTVDGIDNDCDGTVDDGNTASTTYTWYADADGDGYGDASSTTESATQPSGYVSNAADCDDSSAAVSPTDAEVTGDGVDNDCNSSTSDTADSSSSSLSTYYFTASPDSSSVAWNLQVANYSRGEWTNWFASRTTTTGDSTESLTGDVGDWTLVNGDYGAGYLVENTSSLACAEYLSALKVGTTNPATTSYSVTTSTSGADCVCITNETDGDHVQESDEGWNLWCQLK